MVRRIEMIPFVTMTQAAPKKILISPLNWGFGHAGRMIPLALELRKRGHEIIFCADRAIIPMLTNELPGIHITEIQGLHIRYFSKLPQWISVLLHLPHMIAVSVREHNALRQLVAEHMPDIIISDNRFGFRHKSIFSVYVTHQICIPFPAFLRFLEPFGVWLHRKIIEKFDMCLIPDFPGDMNLSGRLSHGVRLPRNTVWSGPLSRFNNTAAPAFPLPAPYRCLILSGPEPQRSILKEKATAAATGMHLVILEGTGEHNTIVRGEKVTFVFNPDTAMMKTLITGSAAVISRSGYTTLMELVSLRKGAIIIPTPGQPEQEYLGEYFDGKWGFVNLKQNDILRIKEPESLLSQSEVHVSPHSGLPDPDLPDSDPSCPRHPDSDFPEGRRFFSELPEGSLPLSGLPEGSLSFSGLPDAGMLLDSAIHRLTEQKI